MPGPVEILLLEDNPNDAALIEGHLKKFDRDFIITHVQNREDYLKVLENDPPDIILCDYQIPGYSGLSAYMDLKELGLKIPYILITGTLTDSFAAEMAKVGIKDYLLKDRLSRLPLAVKNSLALVQ